MTNHENPIQGMLVARESKQVVDTIALNLADPEIRVIHERLLDQGVPGGLVSSIAEFARVNIASNSARVTDRIPSSIEDTDPWGESASNIEPNIPRQIRE